MPGRESGEDPPTSVVFASCSESPEFVSVLGAGEDPEGARAYLCGINRQLREDGWSGDWRAFSNGNADVMVGPSSSSVSLSLLVGKGQE
eukprot:4964730-Pyramimonas_sp.AAC.1